jgi:hypothetical protein
MKTIWVILGLLLAILGIVITTLLTDVPTHAAGFAHPDIPGMQVGGDGMARFSPMYWGILAFQMASLCIITALIYLSVPARRKDRWFHIALVVITFACCYVWWRVFDGYHDFLLSGEVIMVLGFPEPSTWMIFGTWASGVLFCVFYVLGFRRYFFTHAEEKDFEELVNEMKSAEHQK